MGTGSGGGSPGLMHQNPAFARPLLPRLPGMPPVSIGPSSDPSHHLHIPAMPAWRNQARVPGGLQMPQQHHLAAAQRPAMQYQPMRLPMTPVDSQFPSDSRMLPLGPSATDGMLGAFGLNEIDKMERAQHPSMHFVNVLQGGPMASNLPKTRLRGVGQGGEPTFERSLASDSLLLYLGDKPKTPKVDPEENPHMYNVALGTNTSALHDIRKRVLSPSAPPGEYLDDWAVEPETAREPKNGANVPMVSVLVPARVEAGMLCRVPDPDTGDFFEFIVPEGKVPGDIVLVPRN